MAASYTYIEGEWVEGNPGIVGPMSHALWMSSVAFDGARAFDGLMPDLDLHAARAINSARALGLEPKVTVTEIVERAIEGLDHFEAGAALYIRPLFYAEDGFVMPDPASTRFVLSLFEKPLPAAGETLTACVTTRRRPTPEMAPTDAKAACLYPNVGRMLAEASKRGFDTALVRDPNGNVAEFATANLFCVIDGEVHTPVPNGTFLNGITRQRCIGLMRDAGTAVHERTLTVEEVMEADEIIATGNAPKVVAISRLEDRDYQSGPTARRMRDLYWDFAREKGSPEALLKLTRKAA